MDKLEELYSIAFSCNCFEEAYKRGVYDALGDLLQTFSLTWKNDDIDSLLLALTVVQKLYQRLETLQCTYLKIITNGLVSKNHLVDGLLKYLDHRNQHVVFSATKAIVLVFQALPKQMIKTGWFQTLFNFGKETEQPWRRLYAMELLNKILKNPRETLKKRNENSQQQIGNQICSCSREAGNSSMIGTTVSSTELVDLFLGSFNLQHILFDYIPFIVRPNGIYSFMRCSHEVGPSEDFVVLQASLKFGDAIHNQENVKREAISGTKESDFVAFLHCISELAKYLEVNRTLQKKSTADIKSCSEEENYLLWSQESESKHISRKNTAEPCERKTDSICANDMAITHVKDATVNQLCTVMATLIHYLHYPRLPSLIFKKILEVLNQVVVIPSSFMFRQKNKCTKLERIVRSSSLSFLSVVQCCLFRKIPRCSGFVGFSGTEMKSSLESMSNKGSSADLVALRKASLMVFKSSFVVLKSTTKQEGSLLFQNLSLSCVSMWCSGILSPAPDICFNNKSSKESSHESEFHNSLVALFVDQDDDLVEVMMLLLLLFQETHQTVPSCGEISTTILRQLNPHLLFISFAESVEFDHSLLLDLLISSETRFLEYLVQYLHFVIGRWSSFVQCLAEYQEKISCSAEEAMDDDVAMCSVRLKEFESDSNAFEKRTEFESRVANEIRSRENESLFVRQENLGAEVDLGLETSKVHVFRRFSRTNAVTGEDRQCPELPDTFSAFQNNSCKKCETSPELCQCDSRLLGIPSGELNGLTSIVLAYSSSDESEVENADENESANDHVGSAVSQSDEQSDSIICSSVCLNNNKLGSSPFDKADSTETFHSSFTAKSCSGLLQNVSGTPRKHTNNLNNSLFTEHSGFSSNQPVGDSDLKVDGCLGSSSSTKPFPSSDRNTETCVAKESHTEGSVTNSTVVECELLDKVMTMLIRLRLSVARLSSGGHFPYSAAPLMTLMENVEKCYDGC